ncbi:MAG: hypothetical protein JW395_3295 [Nitrospira sp.]|nr:hypothetical protein [Nitrospira sp.]
MEAGEAGLAREELLHGGLFEVALLGDEPVQRAQQRIHIAQRLRDGALFGEWWESDGDSDDIIPVERWNGCRRVESFKPELAQKHINKTRIVTLEILHPKRRVMGPARLFDEKNPPQHSLSACDHHWRLQFRLVVKVGQARRRIDGNTSWFSSRLGYVESSL